MDGCVAVQVEDFGLPKSAVGTVGQTSKISEILNLDFSAVMKTKKTRSARTIILPAVSRRDLCYASENEGFRFYDCQTYLAIVGVFFFPVPGPHFLFNVGLLGPL